MILISRGKDIAWAPGCAALAFYHARLYLQPMSVMTKARSRQIRKPHEPWVEAFFAEMDAPDDAGRAMRVGRIWPNEANGQKCIDDRRSRGGAGRLKVFTSTAG
jgi:hypothetical protein